MATGDLLTAPPATTVQFHWYHYFRIELILATVVVCASGFSVIQPRLSVVWAHRDLYNHNNHNDAAQRCGVDAPRLHSHRQLAVLSLLNDWI